MTDSFIQVPPDDTGKLVDTEQLTVGANTVQRERNQIAGATDTAIAVVASAAPAGGDFGLVVRNIPSGTQTVDSELPAAAALAEATATPTTSTIGSFLHIFNGTTWDFVREGATAGSILVDGSGVTQPVSGTVTANAGTGVFDVTPTSPVATDYLPSRITDGTSFIPFPTALVGGRFDVNVGNTVTVDTEFPAAAALAEAAATPTTTTVGSFNHIFNGATWDFMQEGNVAGSVLVDISDDAARLLGVIDSITNTVTVDSELPAAAALAEGAATPTTSTIGSFNHIFNGTTWDFIREGNVSGSVLVDMSDDATRDLGQVTVDAPVGTPVAVRQSDGAAFIDPRDEARSSETVSRANIDFSASGDNTIVSGVGGQQIKVLGLFLVATAATNIRFKSGAATNISGLMGLAANVGMVLPRTKVGEHWLDTVSGDAFVINSSAAVQVGGAITYIQEA